MKSDTTKRVYNIVAKIPQGKVMTYKAVAVKAGKINPRLVGAILHQNSDPQKIPCHRVVRSDGKIANGYAFGGKVAQSARLRKEGVVFRNADTVDLVKSVWN